MPRTVETERARKAAMELGWIDLPEAKRVSFPVACRHCATAMLEKGPTKFSGRTKSDKIRNGMVGCTTYAVAPRTSVRKYCLECSIDHKVCTPVDASMNNVVIELQAKYQAAFGKPEDSDEYKNYDAVAWLCFNHNSNGEPTKIKDTVKRPAQDRGGKKRKAAAMEAASSSGAAATGGPDPSAGPSVDPVDPRLAMPDGTWEALVMEAALGVADDASSGAEWDWNKDGL